MKEAEIKLDGITHKFVKGEIGLNCWSGVCSLYDKCNTKHNTNICEIFSLPLNGHFIIAK